MSKSRFFIVFTAIVLIFGMCMVLSSCKFDEQNHAHDWETEWTSDDINHWHKCKGCDEIKDNANHSFENGVCICGRTDSSSGGETPSNVTLSYSLSEDESYAICNGFAENSVQCQTINIDSAYLGKPVKEIANKAFYAKTKITNVVIPASVETIGEYAFQNTNLVSINLSNNVKIIQKAAFAKTKIKSVVIPESVIELGAQVFWQCTELESAKISDNVTDLKTYLFYECGKLSKVNIPAKATAIGSTAFAKTALTDINITGNVISIGDYAFQDCNKLKNVTLQDGIEQIGAYAFYQCAVEKIVIPSTVKTMGTNIFWKCSNLRQATINSEKVGDKMFKECALLVDVTISQNTKSIGEYAFQYCTAIYEMILPSNVTMVAKNSFYNLYNLTLRCELAIEDITNLSSNGQCDIIPNYKSNDVDKYGYAYMVFDNVKYQIKVGNNGTAKVARGQAPIFEDVVIVDTINYKYKTYPVTYVDMYAFSDNKTIKSITMGNNIDTIEIGAFQNCSNLENVTFNDGLRQIRDYAFQQCISIKSLRIPASVTTISDRIKNAFENCRAIENIIVDSNNENFSSEGNCIMNKDGTTIIFGFGSTQIPSSAERIRQYAFKGNYNIDKIVLPSNIIYVESRVFFGWRGLTICSELPAKPENGFVAEWNIVLEDVKAPVIWNCNNSNIDEDGYEYTNFGGVRYALKDNEAIVANQFNNLEGEINIPASILYNNKTYFVNKINAYSFCYNIGSMTKVSINGIKNLVENAFYYCSGMYEVTLNGVQVLETRAFNNTSEIRKITISKDLNEIGYRAFNWCYDLETIVFEGTKEEWNAITKDAEWYSSNTGSTSPSKTFVIQCTDGKLDKKGNAI